MINHLKIQNYAIIDEIDIDFNGKLNAITGETGAGKSILMGAMALILGERADSSVLLNKEKKCIVEGGFSADDRPAVKIFLKSNELDEDEELVIRREINSNGKSRAFINDTPVNLEQLRGLSSLLVDLHQQFESLSLTDLQFQLDVLDTVANHEATLKSYRESFRNLAAIRKELDSLNQRKSQFNKESDYNQFLYDELEEAGLKENELEDLELELKLLMNAENIKAALSKVYFEMSESDQALVYQLKSFISQLQPLESYHEELSNILTRLRSVQIELQDISGEISHLNGRVLYDPQRIERINERLNSGYKLLKKHGLQSTSQLLRLQTELESRLQDSLNLDERIGELELEAQKFSNHARGLAESLSANRQKQIPILEKQVNQLLQQVGMPNARLKVVLQQGELSSFGFDTVEFLFDANKSNRFEPMGKVASGGELSRLMLCIKSLVARTVDLPTLIFDEIDSGISGEAAKQVGILLRNLSVNRQVICITHQPQIAGKADEHFLVYKLMTPQGIQTRIRMLLGDERIKSIAEMLSGEKPTAAALENAKEMMMN
ncbi:MAG: DNA repair protein RecN [Chitinophagales bacterium]